MGARRYAALIPHTAKTCNSEVMHNLCMHYFRSLETPENNTVAKISE